MGSPVLLMAACRQSWTGTDPEARTPVRCFEVEGPRSPAVHHLVRDGRSKTAQAVVTPHVRLVQDVDGALACLRACSHGQAQLTRPRYRPSRVSTFSFSPVVMNSGTWIWAPVSSVAGFVPPVERSPWRPGSVCS